MKSLQSLVVHTATTSRNCLTMKAKDANMLYVQKTKGASFVRSKIVPLFVSLTAIVLHIAILWMQFVLFILVVWGVYNGILFPPIQISSQTLLPSITYLLLFTISSMLMLIFTIGWGYHLYVKKKFHKEIWFQITESVKLFKR